MGLTMKKRTGGNGQLALAYRRAGKKEKGKILDTLIELECEGYKPYFRLLLEELVKSSYRLSVEHKNT